MSRQKAQFVFRKYHIQGGYVEIHSTYTFQEMKTLELNQYDLTELSATEQVEIDGGFLPAIWGIGIAASAVLYVIDNWGDISAGYEAGKK